MTEFKSQKFNINKNGKDDIFTFIKILRKHGLPFASFKFNHNKQEIFSIIDISERPFKIAFINFAKATDTLKLDLLNGYQVTIKNRDDFNLLKEILGFGNSKNRFKMKEFFEDTLSGLIPQSYLINDDLRKIDLAYKKIDKESDGIYPIGLKDWAKYHVNHPEVPKDKYLQSNDNLTKVKTLGYFKLYEMLKKSDGYLSVNFSDKKGKKTDGLIKGMKI